MEAQFNKDAYWSKNPIPQGKASLKFNANEIDGKI